MTPPAPPTPPSPPPSETWGDGNGSWGGAPYAAPDIADEVEGWQGQGADAGSSGSGWSVVMEPEDIGPRRATSSGPLSSSARRQHSPMVPLEEISRLQVPQNIRGLPPIARSQGRRMLRRVNTTMFNLVVIALVLGILAIPVVIGLHHIADLQPKVLKSTPAALTPVPTPQLAQGYSGFINSKFSIAYPSDWTHTSSSPTLVTGTATHIEDFVGQGDQGDQEVIVGTAATVPADELSPLVDAAAQLHTQQAVLQAGGAGLNRSYDGQRWIENDYTFIRVRGNTATQIAVRALAVDVGATTYFVVAYGPQKSFGSLNATTIEPMLASFRFQ